MAGSKLVILGLVNHFIQTKMLFAALMVILRHMDRNILSSQQFTGQDLDRAMARAIPVLDPDLHVQSR
jgi:hypothetical protein